MSTEAPAGWEGILEPGEDILWQGRPDGSFELSSQRVTKSIFGAIFAAFAIFWTVKASAVPGPAWVIGLFFLAVGCWLMVEPILWPAFRRRHTWYTLTSQRMFIAKDMPLRGRTLASYAVPSDAHVDFDGETPGTILFATRIDRKGRSVQTGFERIEEAHKVYQLLRMVQDRTGATDAP